MVKAASSEVFQRFCSSKKITRGFTSDATVASVVILEIEKRQSREAFFKCASVITKSSSFKVLMFAVAALLAEAEVDDTDEVAAAVAAAKVEPEAEPAMGDWSPGTLLAGRNSLSGLLLFIPRPEIGFFNMEGWEKKKKRKGREHVMDGEGRKQITLIL